MKDVQKNIDETISWKTFKKYMAALPHKDEDLLPGIKWGSITQLYTPAFWKMQYILSTKGGQIKSHRLCDTIVEEIIMCILGGYGIPSQVGISAFYHLKRQGLLVHNVSFDALHKALASPILTTEGRYIRYRFFNQKAKYVYLLLNRNDLDTIPHEKDTDLRSWLLGIDGIGFKTASWITRNWLKSDKVAIIDVHILRAGKLTGFFKSTTISDYLKMESEYLRFCDALDVYAPDMDAVIWKYMKKNTKLAIRTLIN